MYEFHLTRFFPSVSSGRRQDLGSTEVILLLNSPIPYVSVDTLCGTSTTFLLFFFLQGAYVPYRTIGLTLRSTQYEPLKRYLGRLDRPHTHKSDEQLILLSSCGTLATSFGLCHVPHGRVRDPSGAATDTHSTSLTVSMP